MPDRPVQTPVLIIGAGPTGLVLALGLARRGVPFRIVDEHDGPGQESRAMGVHARTLEFYRQFGFAEEVVEQGIPAQTVHLRRHGRNGKERRTGSFSLRGMGAGLSPYPYLLTYPQDLHERLLLAKLEALGVTVERGVKLAGFEQSGEAVHARVYDGSDTEEIAAAYLVGCDGARSQVRESTGIGFSGGTYEQLFYVADVRIDRGFDKDITVNLGERSLGIMMPVRATGMQRLIGLVPERLRGQARIGFEDIRGEIEPLMSVEVIEVNWFSTYRVHHRVADRFRVGRAFLAGDAGHLHSPAGGQGMNTGIGDAINLGWKLADVLRGRAPATLLDTYEPERLPFARRLVATTDRAFEAMIAPSFTGDLIRTWLAPAVVNLATRLDFSRHAAFRTVSQIAISYDTSPLSQGEAGPVKAGQRLPWIEGINNFAPLTSLDWQVHIYGTARPDLAVACERRGLRLHTFPWNDDVDHSGLKRDTLYLLRPDGHIALIAAEANRALLDAYVDRQGLCFNGP